MDALIRLLDLPSMHPELLWETIVTATAAILADSGAELPFAFALTVENVPGFGSDASRPQGRVGDAHGTGSTHV